MNNEIEIVQSNQPVITDKVDEVIADINNRIALLNIDSLVATEDTISDLKKQKAELSKEFQIFEGQRKSVKSKILEPYTLFEEKYASIKKTYNDAETKLKTKIQDFELTVLATKKSELKEYYKELQDFNNLDWLSFDQLNIKIQLSISVKKYKEQILNRVSEILSDLELIESEKYKVEILVLFKKNLNASLSIRTVRERKRAEKEEQDRILFQRTEKRKTELKALYFLYSDIARAFYYIHNEKIIIAFEDVETLSNENWDEAILYLKEEIAKTTPKKEIQTTVKPLQAPIKEEIPIAEKPKVFCARFEVTAPFDKLQELGAYLKENDYQYKNLK